MLTLQKQREYAFPQSLKGDLPQVIKAKKKTAYSIIDHVGALESTDLMKDAYKLAYSITQHPKDTYTMKQLIQLQSPYCTRISTKQRNLIRFTKHPGQVICICTSLTYSKFILDTWAEKCNNLHIILVEDGYMKPELIDLKEYCPELFSQFEEHIHLYRRCANIWGRALGWSFSAPLYRDTIGGMDEGFQKKFFEKEYLESYECYTVKDGKRKLDKITKQTSTRNTDVLSKISTKPETMLKTRSIASDDECREFFNYYKYLQAHNLLAECLEPGYMICPTCGRPMRDTAEDCDYCTYHQEPDYEEATTYYED